jgi:hypothetical protein
MILLAAAVVVPLAFCDVAKPIYVHTRDVGYLRATQHGLQLLDWIKTHNQKIIDLCGDIPRTMIDGDTK